MRKKRMGARRGGNKLSVWDEMWLDASGELSVTAFLAIIRSARPHSHFAHFIRLASRAALCETLATLFPSNNFRSMLFLRALNIYSISCSLYLSRSPPLSARPAASLGTCEMIRQIKWNACDENVLIVMTRRPFQSDFTSHM